MESSSAATRTAVENFPAFLSGCFKIRRKDGTVSYLQPNAVQRDFILPAIEEAQANREPLDLCFLKPRQVGSSSMFAGYGLWRCLRPNTNVMIVADKKDTAKKILRKIKFAFNHLPRWLVRELDLTLDYDTKTELEFSNGSTIFITSVESKEPGRGDTIQVLILSEAAYYVEADELMRSAFGAVPKGQPGTAIIAESTGNGPAGFFHERYWGGRRKDIGRRSVFAPWFHHEEYTLGDLTVEQLGPLDQDEEVLLKLGATPGNLAWRRGVIDRDYNGDANKFRIEFPATEVEAFLAVESTVFDATMVQKRLLEVAEMKLPDEGMVVPYSAGHQFIHLSPGNLLVWERPLAGHYYAIGGDVGSGIAGPASTKHSYSCADVFDVTTGLQVAHLHEMVEPEIFGPHLVWLGYYYNTALIAPEVTGGHGLSVLHCLTEAHYPALYMRRHFDTASQKWLDKLGWDTTEGNKAMAIDALRADFRTGFVIIMNPDTLREMLMFIRLKSGRLEGVAGQPDDRVMSAAIGNYIRREHAKFAAAQLGRQVEQEKKEEEDEGKPLTPEEYVTQVLRDRRYRRYDETEDMGEVGG